MTPFARVAMLFLGTSMLALVGALVSHAADKLEDAILGVWMTDQKDSKVEILRTGSDYSGKVVWLQEPEHDGKPVVDAKNADAALRNRPILGIDILSGLAYGGDGVWKNGMVYSPRKGKSYPAQISMSKDGRLDIKVKDGMFTKHVLWTR